MTDQKTTANNPTRISRKREETNRLNATITDLKQQNIQLEEQNIRLSKLEGKYRQRSQTLQEANTLEKEKNYRLQSTLDRLQSDAQAMDAKAQTESQKHHHMNATSQSMKEEIHRLQVKLEQQHASLQHHNQLMTQQLPTILTDIAHVKVEMKNHFEQLLNDQREKYEKQLTVYQMEIVKNAAKVEGIALGKKQAFEKNRQAEQMEMDRMRAEEKYLNEDRVRQRSVEIGAVQYEEKTDAFQDPRSILNALIHRLPRSVPLKVQPRVRQELKPSSSSALINFQAALARLREFDGVDEVVATAANGEEVVGDGVDMDIELEDADAAAVAGVDTASAEESKEDDGECHDNNDNEEKKDEEENVESK